MTYLYSVTLNVEGKNFRYTTLSTTHTDAEAKVWARVKAESGGSSYRVVSIVSVEQVDIP